MKRFMFLAVCCAFVLAGVSSLASAAVIDVCTAQDLWNVRNDLTASYRQVCDIDLSGMNWVPIGGPYGGDMGVLDGPFRGTYDGNAKIITGLRFTNDVGFIRVDGGWGLFPYALQSKLYGLFGYSAGTIRNVRLHEVQAVSLHGALGSVGSETPAGVVVGTLVAVNLPSVSGGVGRGNVGSSNYTQLTLPAGVIEHSFVSSIMTLNRIDFAGGIVGYHGGTMRDSSSLMFVTREGDVEGTTVDYTYFKTTLDHGILGGLAGLSSGTIADSFGNVSVRGYFTSAGGIAGSVSSPGSSSSVRILNAPLWSTRLMFPSPARVFDRVRADVVFTRVAFGGGLVASGSPLITASSASGSITGTPLLSPSWGRTLVYVQWATVGGLVGVGQQVSIEQSDSTVRVDSGHAGTAGGSVGALRDAGIMRGVVSRGAVDGSSAAGGLIGQFTGGYTFFVLENSSSTSAVRAVRNAGGLIGTTGPGLLIRNSLATGAVSWNGAQQAGWRDCDSGDCFGGLVGQNRGALIEQSYATGAVSGGNGVGGLVGRHFVRNQTLVYPLYARRGYQPIIFNSYATGSVSGTGVSAGGLVGSVWRSSPADQCEIRNSYSRGAVSGARTGGFIGGNEGTLYCDVLSSYWDTQTSGQANSFGGTGLTTAQMGQFSSFVGWDSNVWSVREGYPVLAAGRAPSAPDLDRGLLVHFAFDAAPLASADPELKVVQSSNRMAGRCFTSLRRFSTNLTSLGAGCPSATSAIGGVKRSFTLFTTNAQSQSDYYTFDGASSSTGDTRVHFVEVPGFTPASETSVSFWFNSHEAFGATRRFELVNIDQRFIIRNDERSALGQSLSCIWYVGGNGTQWDYLASRTVPASAIRTGTYDAWNHVVCTHDGERAKLYLNGELIASSSARAIGWNEAMPGFPPIREVSIGASKFDLGRGYSVNPFSGSIDELRIYNRLLNQSDVTFLASYT